MAWFVLSVVAAVATLGAAGANAQVAPFPLLPRLLGHGSATLSARDNPLFTDAPASRLVFSDPASEAAASPAPRSGSEPVAAAIRGLGASAVGLRPASGAADFAVRPEPRDPGPYTRPAAPRPRLAPDSLAAKGGIDLADGVTWKFADGLHFTFSDNFVGTLGYVGASLDKVRLGFTYRF